MSEVGEKLREALDGFDKALVEDRIEPEGTLGKFAHATRNLIGAMHGVQLGLAGDMLILMQDAKATMTAAARAAEATQRKADLVLAQARTQFDTMQAETAGKLAEAIGEKLGDATVIRAKAFNHTQVTTIAALGAVGALAIFFAGVLCGVLLH